MKAELLKKIAERLDLPELEIQRPDLIIEKLKSEYKKVRQIKEQQPHLRFIA